MLYNLNVETPYEYLLKVWQDILEDTGVVCGKELTIRKALLEDAFLVNIRPEQADTFDNTNVDLIIRTHAFLNMLSPMNYSIFYGDDLLMLISIVVVINGVAEISFLTDVNFTLSTIPVRIAMIKAFKRALDALPFRRVQAKVDSQFKVGQNFVTKLGFQKEGVLRSFGPNCSDYIMYARLVDDVR